jgi:DNA-binding GntR family transcriptional regulator
MRSPPPPSLKTHRPAARPLLKDRAYRELKQLIQTGVFPAGTFLSERQLADRLAMSKTPVRSAVEQLAAQGLVAVAPQQGIVVKDLAVHEMVELFEVRTAVEPYVAAKLAAAGVAADWAARLRASLVEQAAAVDRADPAASTKLDVAFHGMLAECLGNGEIRFWMDRCLDKLYRAIHRIFDHASARIRLAVEEHAAVVDALSAGDPDRAAEAMKTHLRLAVRGLLAS